jgi:hypothetical protein
LESFVHKIQSSPKSLLQTRSSTDPVKVRKELTRPIRLTDADLANVVGGAGLTFGREKLKG